MPQKSIQAEPGGIPAPKVTQRGKPRNTPTPNSAKDDAYTVTITMQPNDRGVLVCRDDNGGYSTTQVGDADSVLNIQRDLIPHISAQPMPTKWLEELRDYLTARIAARADAQAGGYLIKATADGRAFERLQVKRVESDNSDSTGPKVRTAGHAAAESWYSDLRRRADDADGYCVPSEIRQAFIAVPNADQGHFLDAIGALMVFWAVIGEPVPGKIDTAHEAWRQALSTAAQDAESGEGEE